MSLFSSSESAGQTLHVGHGSKCVRRSSQSPSTMPPINASSSSTGGIISSPSDLLPRAASVASTADITRRFGIMLEAMRTAGFHDFDGMAAAYYTAEFERGSFPAMVQSASRSRRLKPLLQKLQESSSRWPRWESRGLRESVLEATGESGRSPPLITRTDQYPPGFQHPFAWERWSVLMKLKQTTHIKVSQRVILPRSSGCYGAMGAAYKAITRAIRVIRKI